MSFLDYFRPKHEIKTSATSQTYVVNGNHVIGDPHDKIKMAEEGYIRNCVFYACVRRIANQLLTVPIKLMKNGKEIDVHPLLDLIKSPNLSEGYNEFMFSIASYILIYGNAYIEMAFTNRNPDPQEGKPVYLYALDPDKIKIKPSSNGLPAAYIFENNGLKTTFPVTNIGRSNIIHVSEFHPLNHWEGLSPLTPTAWSIDQHNAASEWNYKLLANGGKLDYLLKVSSIDLTDEQNRELKNLFQQNYSGPSNAGNTAVVDAEIEVEALGMNPKDMDWIKGYEVAAKNICISLGVPPDLIFGQATYENLESANEQMAENTTIPLIEHIISELNRGLVYRYDSNLELVCEKDMMPALMPKRDRKRDSLEKTTFLTINEKREEMGREPIEGGDTLYVDFGRVPLNQAGQSLKPLPNDQQKYIDELVNDGYEVKQAQKIAEIVYGAHSSN